MVLAWVLRLVNLLMQVVMEEEKNAAIMQIAQETNKGQHVAMVIV